MDIEFCCCFKFNNLASICRSVASQLIFLLLFNERERKREMKKEERDAAHKNCEHNVHFLSLKP